jgi:hypothetical protein
VPIRSASDMYGFTAGRIFDDPFVVLRRKVKPARARVMWRVACNAAGEVRRAAAARRGGVAPLGQEAR